jgi:hypothetical protein
LFMVKGGTPYDAPAQPPTGDCADLIAERDAEWINHLTPPA